MRFGSMKHNKKIFIIEFKINQSEKDAIHQIKERAYAEKYPNDKRQKKLPGINFNTKTRKVDDYILLQGKYRFTNLIAIRNEFHKSIWKNQLIYLSLLRISIKIKKLWTKTQ
ncbi:MAG: PD-(D/E)XK nuclease domain-containing protein [Bacteroidota bacterium]|nr:PD-(D/E)XK nuclease domain-containing protein [Bacteroidota bacterium]